MKNKKICVGQYSKRLLKDRECLRCTYNVVVDYLASSLYSDSEVSLISIVNAAVKEAEADHNIKVNVFVDRGTFRLNESGTRCL